MLENLLESCAAFPKLGVRQPEDILMYLMPFALYLGLTDIPIAAHVTLIENASC